MRLVALKSLPVEEPEDDLGLGAQVGECERDAALEAITIATTITTTTTPDHVHGQEGKVIEDVSDCGTKIAKLQSA